MNRADEIVSPLMHGDTDRVCVVSASLVAECAVCGLVTSGGGAHVPFIAYGFRCAACCPCRTYVASDAEREAMAGVRASLARAWAATKAKAQVRRAARGPVTEGLLRADGTTRKIALTPAMRASLEKCWAIKRGAKAGRPTEP